MHYNFEFGKFAFLLSKVVPSSGEKKITGGKMRVIVMFLAVVEVTFGFKIKSEKAKLVKVAIKSGQCGHDKTEQLNYGNPS